MQNGPLELLDKELEPLQVFPAGNRWKPAYLSFSAGFSYLLERSLSSSSIWSIFLSKSGTWYSQHGLDLDFDHLKNNWWSPLTRSHTCCKASRCTGPKGPWVDFDDGSFLLRLLIILVESLSQYHHQYSYQYLDHHHYRGNIIPSSQSSQVTPATFVWSSVGSLQRGHIHQKYLVDMIMMIVMIVMEMDMMIIKMKMIYNEGTYT